jgi:flagellar basal-body rod modification protein FlgD
MDAAVAISTAANPIAPAQGKGMSGISGDDFMKILIKQLQMQDPLEPMNNQEMIAQMSTIRELEMNTRLSQKLEQLTDQQRFGSAASLIGKHVKGTVSDAEGNEFDKEGVVVSIRFTSKGEAILELDSGQVLPLTNLEEVKNADGSDALITPELLAGQESI